MPVYRPSPPPRWLIEVLAGFAYWVVFLLVLEPGNIQRALNAGRELSLEREVLRISVAASLGAAATPLALWLSRRFFPGKRRNPLILLAGMSLLSLVLIIASCFLAAWIWEHRWLPLLENVSRVLTGNGLLVLFALLAFGALEQALSRKTENPATESILRHVMIKTRDRQFKLDLADVERIEAQGNYLALHTRSATHLVRGTMAAMSAQIDTARFIRIHRQQIVALDQIVQIESFDNGDGMAHLKDGREVKISRNYRKALLSRFRA